MPFVWAAIGAIVSAYFSEKWCKRVVRGSLLAGYIPLARDPALAQAFAQSIGMTGSPEMMAMFHRLLDEVRAEMAAGRISFRLRGDDSPSGFTVDLLHPATAAAGALMLPGYDWPVQAGPSGANWTFDPRDVDVSSGEPIVRTANGYWVWGRGCTQPGGGIAPAWGFVRTRAASRMQAATGGGASYESILNSPTDTVRFGPSHQPELTNAQLSAPLLNSSIITRCGAPDDMSVKIQVAVKMGSAVGVTVTTAPPNRVVAACIDQATRRLQWPASPKTDFVTVTF
jgi:hypothetical protein